MSSFANQLESIFNRCCPAGNNVIAQAYYDPHYISFNNENFTRQPPNSAVLFDNPSYELKIIAIHGPVQSYLPNSPTVINDLEIIIKSQRINYFGRTNTFRVDGQDPLFHGEWAFLEETKTSIVKINTYTHYIYAASGAKLTIYNSRGYNLNVTLTLPRPLAVDAKPSLFGNINGGHGVIIGI